jgi:hypothetical protein
MAFIFNTYEIASNTYKCTDNKADVLCHWWLSKGNNKITELRTIFQRESQNS